MSSGSEEPRRLVRQQHDYGCGIASLAMVSDTSYEYVRMWLVDNWPSGQGHTPRGDWLVKRGIHKGIADYFLAGHGYAWRTLYSAWYGHGADRDGWAPEPFAPVHLASVVQPSGNSHYVVMCADGVVLDPMTDEPRKLSDWPSINNVQGVWHV